jgi:glucosamine 6-phosphate synthetase-like amidotransferase/phosphosugar isomerase protein
MCGIAGYSLSTKSSVDRTLAAQALLASIADRGADAAGYAYRTAGDPSVHGHKQRSGATALIEQIAVPADAVEALVHVRDYTKGLPTIPANNHPIRHGSVVGIHNGIIFNDEDVLAENRIRRAHPEMTVDSEAIFALAEASQGRAHVFEQLRGSMACAWLDERRPDVLFLTRGVGRPLWVGVGKHESLFASTKRALEIVEDFLGLRLRKHELDEGMLLALSQGREAWCERFRPDRQFQERNLPSVRAPHEGASCLRRLATLAAAPSSG